MEKPTTEAGNSRREPTPCSLPDDVALAIASSLEASDTCSLGSCSRAWRDICASDCLWFVLSKKRWPALASSSDSAAAELEHSQHAQEWRTFYISKHRKLAASVFSVIQYIEQCSQNASLEVGYYLKAIEELCSIELGFKDVQLFLLTSKRSVLLNLIGLHYSLFYLGVSHKDVMETLESHHISERRVSVSWFKLGRWFYGFRLPDESWTRRVSLGDLTSDKEALTLGVLNRGVVHEVLRVQITSLV